MKTSLVAVFVAMAFVASTGTVSAQIIGGGAKIGVNFADVSGDVGEETSMRMGLLVGGFLTVPASGPIAFQPEVLYSQQGTKFEDDGDDFTVEIDEIQIPLLLRVGGSVGYVLAGPQIGFITSAKVTSENFDGLEQDIKDDLKSTDVGFLFGAGANINRFLIEARYTLGLNNLNEIGNEDDNKSRVFSILVGVGF